nr:NAD(P)H-dependent oxidoreductase [Novosphingobium pokkalii]
MAAAAAEGAAQGGAAFALLSADVATPDDCVAAQGFLFVCPENLGSMSGEMKAFFDRCYYPLLGRIEGRPYATAIAAGTAGQGTQGQIDRIVTGWRLRRVAPPCIVLTGADRPDSILATKSLPHTALQKCRDLGQLLSTGMEMGAF